MVMARVPEMDALEEEEPLSEGEKEFQLSVMCKILEMHGCEPCDNLEDGE